MAAEAEKVEPADSEQEEEVEDVYEVERIIDMRMEEGEVLYRVRWKNYCSDDDTWEPEAHLEDCREVLLAFKKSMAEIKAKKEAEAKKTVVSKILPTKSDVFDADSESESDKDRPADLPVKKKKKKKIREEDEEQPSKDKKKKKKDKRKDDVRPLPAPETDDDEEEEEEEETERVPTPPSPPKEKKTDTKKRVVDSDDEDDEPVPSKKHKKEKGKEGGKHRKEKGEEGKKKKGKKERKVETSDDEAAAPLEDDLSDSPSQSQMDDAASTDTVAKSAEKPRLEDKFKQKKGKWEVKLQGIKDLIHDKKNKKPEAPQKEISLQKLKNLTSKVKEDAAPHSDSSDSSTLHKKAKSKGQESKGQESKGQESKGQESKGQESTSAPPKVPSSSTSSSSSSSSVTAPSSAKVREEEVVAKEEALGPKDTSGSTNLFEKFLLNCEAKDRAPRRPPAVHQAPPEKVTPKPAKVIGKIEKTDKISKTTKDSPAQKQEPEKTEKTKQTDVSKPGQSYGFSLDSEEREAEESAAKQKPGEESRERKERSEEAQRPSWERKTPTEDRRKRREDSEPRLFMACDDNQDPPEGVDKSDKGQATLSLGMDLNLDWMTLDDFQKHLNGEDEILSGPPLSPSELRDAVKSGDYMAVKLALNSKEDYNLDQEDVSGMSLSMLAAAGGQDDILRLLIKKGVRVNGRQKNGTTALMHAAEKNFLTTVAILLEAGSYVNAQTLNGETALMKACKRGNADVVRLLLEYGADCNIVSKNKTAAMYFAKLGNNLMVCDLIKDHINILSSVAEDTIRAYFESRLVLLEPVFPLACHRLCEGPDFSLEFGYKVQPQPEGSGILLFIFHANFLNEITARLCGPCSVHAVVLNDKFQLPIFLDSHFIYSFSPVPGINRLFIRLAEAPTAKVKLLICAYRVQLQ
ncbi:M-phase phosphoprotein 8 isoform X4 [Centropristis striata]|uniref:M-phase phosphoprotein 8 isoform X4 n=1 Tax=Centropristis striata TaxID=184440 RepID=UPI0027DEB09A|nr:M-phase phosphoprotein 8 isoform X4 [Centropristis striata]